MRAKPRQRNNGESIISFGLLAVLLLIGLWLLIGQLNVDMRRFGIEATAGEVSADRPEAGRKPETALHAFAPSGFESIGQTQVYSAENLYEKINGKW